MSLRLALIVALAGAGCAATQPAAVRAPQPQFDLSRICDDARYSSVCREPAAAPDVEAPVRVDTNLATPPLSTLALG